MKYRKGDRVEFTEKGVKKYGVVLKGGSKKIEVIVDGAEFIVKGSPKAFRPLRRPWGRVQTRKDVQYSGRGRSRLLRRYQSQQENL
jgi:hypothetical protein